MFCTFEQLFTVRLLLPLSGAGSKCFLQEFEMVILFNRDCLAHQIAYIKHFCFHKKYVQLHWKTWSCSFSGLPKRKCFLFLRENIIFLIIARQRVISRQNFLWEKFLLINSLPYPGEGFLCCSFSWWEQRDQKRGHVAAAEPWRCSPLESKGLFWQGRRGQSFLGLSLQWHLAVELMGYG